MMTNKRDNVVGISVVFSLPYLIFVEDGFNIQDEENLEIDEKKVLQDAYVIKLDDGIEVGIQFCKRANINNDASVKMCGAVNGDRTGKNGYSFVKVNFISEQFEKEKYFNMIHFAFLSVKAVNKFIEHYRFITMKYYIDKVTSQTIQTFTTITYLNDGTSQSQVYGDANGPLYGMGGAIPSNENEEIRQSLIEDKEISLIDSMHLDILDKIDLKEYRFSVIESAIMYETWLNIFIRNKLKEKGLSEDEIEKKLKNKRGEPRSAYNLSKTMIKELTSIDFSKTEDFDNWCLHTKNLRNEIVHGKKYSVTKDEAIKAYHSAIHPINKMELTVHNINRGFFKFKKEAWRDEYE